MTAPRDARLLVVGLGGSALRAAPGGRVASLAHGLAPLVDLLAAGYRLVLTHGRGPQAEDTLARGDAARKTVPPLSLDLCGAETQGAVGYALQQALDRLCRARGLDVPVATIVTRVLVDAADPAFAHPTVPVGPAYTAARARQLERASGWTLGAVAGRRFRRVVPAPRPLRVLEAQVVRRATWGGGVLIACGDGGIPVVEADGAYRGVEAAIEPALATETLATALDADRMVLVTAVERLSVSHGTPGALAIERLSLADARALLAAGEFPPESTGPKVAAGIRFVERGGREAVITSLDRVAEALDGDEGTRIVP